MARQFNGSTDKIQWDAPAPLIAQGVRYTMCAWVYADSTSAGSHGIFVSGAAAGGYAFQMRRTGSDWEFFQQAGGVDVQTKDSSGVVASTWTHLVATWNGSSTTTLYKNGISKATASATGMTANRAGVRTSIGYIWDGAGAFFNGRIADLAVWQELLSPAEIRLLGTGISRPNEIRPWALTSFYPFDAASLWSKGRIQSPAVVTGGSPTLLTEPSLVALRPTKLLLPYVPYTSRARRRFVTPFRTSHI